MLFWILRVILAILWFIVVYVGGTWLLNTQLGLGVPDLFMKAVAALVALGWFVGDMRYGWTTNWTGRPVA